jgi:hypothetical protein
MAGWLPAIGDVLQLDVARLAQQHADEVRHRTGRRRAVVGLVGVGLASGQELRDALHAVGHRGADAETEVEGAGERGGRHVGAGVISGPRMASAAAAPDRRTKPRRLWCMVFPPWIQLSARTVAERAGRAKRRSRCTRRGPPLWSAAPDP